MVEETVPEEKSDLEAELDAVVEETQADFDLFENLKSRPMLEDSVVVFTDEITAKQLGGVTVSQNMVGDDTTERWGVLGRISEIASQIDHPGTLPEEKKELLKEAKGLKAEALELHKKLLETSATVTIRAFPKIAQKVINREVKKRFVKKGQSKVDESRMEEFQEAFTHAVLSESIVGVTQASGAKKSHLEVEEVEGLENFLPDTEWDKIVALLNKVQYKDVIAKNAGEQLDFS